MLKQMIIVAILGCAIPNSTAALPGPSKGPSLAAQTVSLDIVHCEFVAIVMWHGEQRAGLFCIAEIPEDLPMPAPVIVPVYH